MSDFTETPESIRFSRKSQRNKEIRAFAAGWISYTKSPRLVSLAMGTPRVEIPLDLAWTYESQFLKRRSIASQLLKRSARLTAVSLRKPAVLKSC